MQQGKQRRLSQGVIDGAQTANSFIYYDGGGPSFPCFEKIASEIATSVEIACLHRRGQILGLAHRVP